MWEPMSKFIAAKRTAGLDPRSSFPPEGPKESWSFLGGQHQRDTK